ncbi:EAL domain-containing protein [soil metagenome]
MSSVVTFATAPKVQVNFEAQVAKTYVARQPLLDRKQELFGYELLSRTDADAQSSAAVHTASSDTALMFSVLSNFGSEVLFGDKLAFVNCALEALSGEHLEIVFPERMVLEIPRVPGEDAAAITEIGAQIAKLKARGFRIAVGAYALLPAYSTWLPLVSFLKIDTLTASDALARAALQLSTQHKAIKVVAEKVESHEQFKKYFDLGYHYFQGFHFAKPQTVSAKVINPAYTNVLQLMDLVLKQAEVTDIEQVLKRDPALSFKLLRYINSSGFGLSCEVSSFRHAVMILGFNKLFRWLTLLFATVRNGSVAPALARNAVTRGRMMELIAQKLMEPDECDNAFVIGIFSTLDVMLGVSMEKALGSITLPESVGDALLARQGQYGPFLKLVEACERADIVGLENLALMLQLDGAEVTQAHLQALAWVETLGI